MFYSYLVYYKTYDSFMKAHESFMKAFEDKLKALIKSWSLNSKLNHHKVFKKFLIAFFQPQQDFYMRLDTSLKLFSLIVSHQS